MDEAGVRFLLACVDDPIGEQRLCAQGVLERILDSFVEVRHVVLGSGNGHWE